ncbi:MAG TPA: flavodoxin domain-containing protein [Methanomassiliicoccales archaeon]|jgi:flavodoxin
MKGKVAYDSVHGNSKKVAESIANEIKSNGHEVDLISVTKGCEAPNRGEFLFIGSPTRIGRMTGDTRAFPTNLDVNYWKSRPIVPFDTIGPLSKDPKKRMVWMERVDQGDKNAGSHTRKLYQERGMTACEVTLHAAVIGFIGPLTPEALDISREYPKGFLNRLR